MVEKQNNSGLWATESRPMSEEDFKRLLSKVRDYYKREFGPAYEVLSPQEYDRRVAHYKKLEARSESKV